MREKNNSMEEFELRLLQIKDILQEKYGMGNSKLTLVDYPNLSNYIIGNKFLEGLERKELVILLSFPDEESARTKLKELNKNNPFIPFKAWVTPRNIYLGKKPNDQWYIQFKERYFSYHNSRRIVQEYSDLSKFYQGVYSTDCSDIALTKLYQEWGIKPNMLKVIIRYIKRIDGENKEGISRAQ